MKRRIFVALPLEKQLQEEILAWEHEFKKLPVRWLTGKNLHSTLVPPWYTGDVEIVIEKLRSVQRSIQSFDTTFSHVAYGPTVREPRLIWAEGETPHELSALKVSIEQVLDVEPEKKLFKLHLTLARFRPETFSSFSHKTLDEKVSWRQHSKRFVLMESHLSRTGADYEIIESFIIA